MPQCMFEGGTLEVVKHLGPYICVLLTINYVSVGLSALNINSNFK